MAILKRKSQSLVSKINNKLIIHVKRVRLLEIEAVPFHRIGKFFKLPYTMKKRSAKDRTAAEM